MESKTNKNRDAATEPALTSEQKWEAALAKVPEATRNRMREMKDNQQASPIFGEIDGQLSIKYKDEEDLGILTTITTLGVKEWEYAREQILALGNASAREGDSVEATANRATANFAAIASIAPVDAIESMLAVQMVATHRAVMKSLAQLSTCESYDDCNGYMNRATKLMNVYTRQIEALNKHRGKGQQKMTVEHVHVNEGGQAIIGTVEGGGGGNTKKGVQPHALRSKD